MIKSMLNFSFLASKLRHFFILQPDKRQENCESCAQCGRLGIYVSSALKNSSRGLKRFSKYLFSEMRSLPSKNSKKEFELGYQGYIFF